jgi:hypothetical protein
VSDKNRLAGINGDHEPVKDGINQQPSSTEIAKPKQGGDSELRFHPAANTFPPMEGAEFDALVADIKTNGQIFPILTYEGMILDGRNRYRACLAAGVEPDVKALEDLGDCAGETHDGLVSFVISTNFHRRHLTANQKREIIAKLLKASPEKSDREIGRLIKTDKNTVASVRAKEETRGEIHHVDMRTDTKGRKQPAKKKARPKRERATIEVHTPNPNGSYSRRPATESEADALVDAMRRTAAAGASTPCDVSAALSNPIIAAWRAANEFYREHFVRLYSADVQRVLDEIKREDDDPRPIPACPVRAAQDGAP